MCILVIIELSTTASDERYKLYRNPKNSMFLCAEPVDCGGLGDPGVDTSSTHACSNAWFQSGQGSNVYISLARWQLVWK